MSGFRQSVVRWFMTTKKTTPVPVVSGRNTADNLYEDILRENCKAAFIATSKTVRNKGMLDKLAENLTENGIKAVFFSDIVPDPTIENVERGLAVYRENGCDCVIAVGGGSVLDCAKVIALRAANPRVSVKMMSLYVVPCRKSAPIFAVMNELNLTPIIRITSDESVKSNPFFINTLRFLSFSKPAPPLLSSFYIYLE